MMETQSNTPIFIKQWAANLKNRGLATPAMLLLEIHKPLSFTTSQVILIGQPLLNCFLPTQITHQMVNLFSNRTYLNQFMKALEE